jgi:hypothetical protein
MIEARYLQLRVTEGNAVGNQRGGQQIEIRAVGQQIAMQGRVVGELTRQAEP